MTSKKLMIIGSEGQLAYDLKRVLKRKFTVISVPHSLLDVTHKSKVNKYIKEKKPAIVINTAAFHNTTKCELNPGKSFRVNAIGAYNVSKAASKVGARIVFFSSDYVFDGTKRSFSENDLPNPLNVYGASKLAGENLTRIANGNHIIIRTSWLFGIHRSGKGHDFVSLMLEKVKKEKELKVVNDQFGSPTYTLDLASMIEKLLIENVPSGTYHTSGGGGTTWYGFAKEIFALSKITVKLRPVNSDEFPSIFKRPNYSILKNNKIAKLNIKPMRSWKLALKSHLDEVARLN